MKPLKSPNEAKNPKMAKRRWVRIMSGLLLVVTLLSVAAGVLGIYGVLVERGKLMVEQQTITMRGERLGQTLRVAHFSDTHLGPFFSLERLQILVDAINSEEPDMVFFTGDLVDKPRRYSDWNGVAEVLSKLAPKVGKYAVPGNHDYIRGSSSKVEQTLEDSGFVFLRNKQATVLGANGYTLNVIGLDDAQNGKPTYKILAKSATENSKTIVLAHAPDMALKMKGYDVDLVLSGHTHGGQVKLPLVGVIYTPPFGRQFIRGLYETAFGVWVYVDSGAGETGLPVRLGVPPQFSVLQLEV